MPEQSEFFQLLQFFGYEHLPPDLQGVGREFHQFAHNLAIGNKVNTESVAGLRKLLEAKDCFVRAKLMDGV